MRYGEFMKLAKSTSDREFSIEEIEEQFWQTIGAETIYSLHNKISLFGDETEQWNLDRFTKAESNIHFETTHHSVKV